MRSSVALALCAWTVAGGAGCGRGVTCAQAAAKLTALDREERARLGRPAKPEVIARKVLHFTNRCEQEIARDADNRARLVCVLEATRLSAAEACLKGW
ncbi:MAG TPA: hypothetical protein VGQ83_25615 [Polyangia bacterium]|jgi:hypothetical protein